MATAEPQSRATVLGALRTARRILARAAVPVPAWALWGLAATLSLACTVTALGIAVALSETTAMWWIVLPFGTLPAIAVLVSVDRVIKAALSDARPENATTDRPPPPHPAEAPPGVVRANGNGRAVLVDDLTDREREVLALLSTGRTNGEIAGELYVANGTIKSHVNAICRKLGARNRTEAVARARYYGLVQES